MRLHCNNVRTPFVSLSCPWGGVGCNLALKLT